MSCWRSSGTIELDKIIEAGYEAIVMVIETADSSKRNVYIISQKIRFLTRSDLSPTLESHIREVLSCYKNNTDALSKGLPTFMYFLKRIPDVKHVFTFVDPNVNPKSRSSGKIYFLHIKHLIQPS